MILLLFAILFIILVGVEVIVNPNMAIIVGVLLLLTWGLLTFLVAKMLLTGATRGLKKLRYKKKVLFLSVDNNNIDKLYIKELSVIEYVDGRFSLMNYIVNNNVFLPKDTPYGKVIYKYSVKAESGRLDLNYFSID